MRKTAPRRIAILYPSVSTSWMIPCLGGMQRYARAQGGWHLFNSPSMLHGGQDLATILRSLRGWKGDGIIAASNDESELRAIEKMGMPAVNLSGYLPKPFGIPRVLVDNIQAGRLAAEHLLDRGLRHLGFLGRKEPWFSEQRYLGFGTRATEAGVKCASLLLSSVDQPDQDWRERIDLIVRWVVSLDGPVGVFTVYDWAALLLIEACQQANLRIPDDVAVIGMDNIEMVCAHSVPTLSSVSSSLEQVGWGAAALLDRMMKGESPPTGDVLVEPDGVVARESTNMLYCSEPVLRGAVEYMREHLTGQFNVEELADHLAVSKRTLETRFRKGFQTSPYEFLTRLRVENIQSLLQAKKKRPLSETARESGFGSIRAMRAAFQRVAGESLDTFRRKSVAREDALGRR